MLAVAGRAATQTIMGAEEVLRMGDRAVLAAMRHLTEEARLRGRAGLEGVGTLLISMGLLSVETELRAETGVMLWEEVVAGAETRTTMRRRLREEEEAAALVAVRHLLEEARLVGREGLEGVATLLVPEGYLQVIKR